jgi:dolichol-phosphate mannosyltransferase
VDLSLILPAYAEADNLRRLLPELIEVLNELAPVFEVLVVDAVEPLDDTPAICQTYGVRRIPRQGGDEYGHAIRTGIRSSSGTWVMTMDVDGSHDPAFVRELWRRRDDADIIIASRYAHGGSTDNPFLLVLFSRILNAIFARVLHVPVHDVSNSFRIYRGDRVRALELTSLHFDILEEILARLLCTPHQPATVLELPFRFRRRLLGESKRSMPVFIHAFLGAVMRLWILKRRLQKTPV